MKMGTERTQKDRMGDGGTEERIFHTLIRPKPEEPMR